MKPALLAFILGCIFTLALTQSASRPVVVAAPAKSQACELADIAPTDSNIEACLGRPWWQD